MAVVPPAGRVLFQQATLRLDTIHMAHLTALPNQNRLRILAADSTSMSTQLLVEALARDTQFQMIESPSTEGVILSLVKREKPHVAVISARLGETGRGAFDLVRNIRAHVPGTRVVVMIDTSERGAVVEAFRAGAAGVFCRTEPFRLLAKCIQCVHAGQVWASSSEMHFLLDALAQPTFANFRNSSSSPLSAREVDVVRCVAEGLTNREIAQRLKLTEHTVKNYLFRIFDKLGVSSRVEVVLYALGSASGWHPEGNSSRGQLEPRALPTRTVSGPVAMRRTAT
jgi:two-component system nitrate/nitrite response regulator NarL